MSNGLTFATGFSAHGRRCWRSKSFGFLTPVKQAASTSTDATRPLESLRAA
jgi:hypothetical protein